MRFSSWALLLLSLQGCVSLPEGSAPAESTSTLASGVFPGLDPGGKEVSGLHFTVKAYGSSRAAEILEAAEAQYNRIMGDTGLYSFRPRGLYEIVIYADAGEYHRKTQFAAWSAGLTVDNAIYSYDGPHLAGVLAHEMTHLIFHEYMGGSPLELRWINEGLAVYEEAQATGHRALATFPRQLQPVPFDQMAALVPASEREREVNRWYQQVGDVAGFMIERGGRIGFSQCLAALKERKGIDEAVRLGFAGIWSGMSALEAAWQGSLSGR